MRGQTGLLVVILVLVILPINLCTGLVSRPTPTTNPQPTNTLVPTVVEPGLAYGYPCKPPCWRGLVPGQSTRQEAEQAMEKLLVDGWADDIGGSPGRGYSVYPLPGTRGSIIVGLVDDIVTEIIGGVNFDYTIGSVIEQFGPPEWLYLETKSDSADLSCETWELSDSPYNVAIASPVYVLYPSQGLFFSMMIPWNGIGRLCPEMRMNSFCYYAPLSIAEALDDNYLAGLCNENLKGVVEEDLVRWHGFGGGY